MSYDETPSSPNPPAQPAGWYPDDTGQQRYWDGAAWTEHTAPAAAPETAAYDQSQYAQQGYAQQYPQQYTGYAVGAVPTSDEKTMATLAHVLAIFAAFLGPLIILLVKGDQSVFVKHHAIEALNFAITVTIAAIVSGILVIVLIGLLLLPVIFIGALVLQIMAAMAANRGEWYRYPMTLRLISGPAV